MALASFLRRGAAVSAVALLAAVASAPAPPTRPADPRRAAPVAAQQELDADEIGLLGNAGRPKDSTKPKVTAYFRHESYGPGDRAELVVADSAPSLTVQIYRAGGEAVETRPNDVMLGTPLGRRLHVGAVRGRRTIALTIGAWPSGVYFARLRAPGARVGFAPFVLRPSHLGGQRVAVVLPTETWQAYNFRDDDADGHPDTWYAGWRTRQARLIRPFLDRGVPPHWSHYDAPFVRWLTATHRHVDYLSDAELRRVPDGDRLADAYDLIVFPGHHEYVTTHEYDVVQRYRDLGGNLAFLAANDFFWKITIHKSVMTRVAEWRDLGRPEAALIGVQYRANDRGGHRGPWRLRGGASSTPWLLTETGLAPGASFGRGGIEIDSTAPSSPSTTTVLAEISNLYGPGYTAQMTYYETSAGARVFAAGAFSLADDVWSPVVEQLVSNLWDHLELP